MSDGQSRFDVALFSIKGTNNAAAQEFVTADSHLKKVSLYLSSGAATGTITVQIRTVHNDAGTVISSHTLDFARLGGSGAAGQSGRG